MRDKVSREVEWTLEEHDQGDNGAHEYRNWDGGMGAFRRQ